MLKNFVYACSILIALSLVACTKGTEGKTPKTSAQAASEKMKKKPFHGDMKTVDPAAMAVDAVKKNHLELSSTKTIGDVFDSYRHAKKKEWRGTQGTNGHYYVDYIATFDVPRNDPLAIRDGVVQRKLEVKFVIREDGETYVAVASRFDIKGDGAFATTRYFPQDVKKIVSAIYDNQEIPF